MRFIITDFKRSFTEKSFMASVVIGIICMGISFLYYIFTNEIHDSTSAFITTQSLILPFIAPLLAAIPYSNMGMIEKDFGYERLLLIKGGKRDYIFKRWLTNGITGGIALCLPLLIFLGVCRILSPFNNINEVLGVIALDFFFGFAYASIAYGLTFVNTKRYIPVVAPQVIYFLFIYSFPYLNLEAYYPPLGFSPWVMEMYFNIETIALQLGLICISSLMFVLIGKVQRKMKN